MATRNFYSGAYCLLAAALFAFPLAADAEQAPWHAEPIPRTLHQEVSFANGNARLAGTLYLATV